MVGLNQPTIRRFHWLPHRFIPYSSPHNDLNVKSKFSLKGEEV